MINDVNNLPLRKRGAPLQRQDPKNFMYVKGEPELTDPFNLLINVKLRML